MDDTNFASAQALYESGDYQRAQDAFSAILHEQTDELEPGETGYVLHMIGNCLTKQRRFVEAAAVYHRALNDEAYLRRGSLNVNMGMALCAQKHYEESLPYFEAALDDETYTTKYKAYSAMGNAQLKLGNALEAGSSYRRAALENNNPDPAKCLVNLGVCFMALNRPTDAVESYVTALEFEEKPDERNKTYANLGQAYVATGRMNEALGSFETALSDGTYRLNEAARIDYERARTVVEAEHAADAGLDRFEDPYAAAATMAMSPVDSYGGASTEMPVIPPADDTDFFSMSDEEIDARGRNKIKDQRKQRNIGPKVFLVIAIILLIVVLSGGFLYYRGYGYPTQETVITNMLTAYAQGGDYQQYWADAESADIESAMGSVGKTTNITVDAVQRSLSSSTAQVTETLSEGGEVHYEVTLGRDVLSWKIKDIQLVFDSSQ